MILLKFMQRAASLRGLGQIAPNNISYKDANLKSENNLRMIDV